MFSGIELQVVLKIVISSTKISVRVPFACKGRSLIKNKKRSEPKTEPCGTPDRICFALDNFPDTEPFWLLSWMYDLNQESDTLRACEVNKNECFWKIQQNVLSDLLYHHLLNLSTCQPLQWDLFYMNGLLWILTGACVPKNDRDWAAVTCAFFWALVMTWCDFCQFKRFLDCPILSD